VDAVMLRVNLPDAEPPEVVFSYLRLDATDVEEYGARRKDLENYAAKHNLRVSRVFVDEGYSDSVVSRSGFAQLCLLLRLEQPHGVLILQPEDLSSSEATALTLARRIWAAGVDIYTVHGEAPFTDRQPTS
jgi:DNA invertase Pin-like site-specific DNA recombinase